jgi:two-component system, chemotaxis family, CheB/CheR fusion protein
LVVDDYPQSAESFAILLSTENFTVSVADSGEAALQIFDQLRPGAVILDIGMGPLSGLDVAKAIRSRAHGTRTLLIAIDKLRWQLSVVRKPF